MTEGDSELKRKTAKGLLWGGIGNGGMQLLSLLFGIFLSRILVPTDYGKIGALTIFIALGGMLAESGFTLALVNKKRLDDADLDSVFWFNLVVSLMSYTVLFLVAPLVGRFYDAPETTGLLRFMSLGFIAGATSSAPTAYLFRNLKVKERSRAQIGAMIVSGIVGVTCALCRLGCWALAIQNLTYLTVNAALLWRQTPWRPTLRFDAERIRQLLPFSTKQLAVTFFFNVNNNFFPVILGRFYGMWPTGCYTQGSKWTTMGSNTIKGMIDSVGQPVLREASAETERLHRVFGKMLRFAAFISFPCMLGLGLVSEEVIVLTITEKWLECVPIMQILCVWGAFVPIVQLYGNLFNSTNHPGIYMWNTILPGVLQLGAIFFTFHYGINFMLEVYVALNVLWLCVWQYQAKRHFGLGFIEAGRQLAPYVLISCFAIAVAALAAHWTSNLYLSLLIKVAVAAAIYVGIMWGAKSVVFKETIDYLFHKKTKGAPAADKTTTTPQP